MRSRRKQRVVWLPPDPNNRIAQQGPVGPTFNSLGTAEIITAQNPGDFAGTAFPVAGDIGNADNFVMDGAHSLSDLFNSGYRLRRICGQLFVCCRQRQYQDVLSATNWLVTAAFQVMRVDTTGNPVDAQAAAPDILVNQDNPWIWRRSWLMTNFGAFTPGPDDPYGSVSNLGLSVREGTFVDQKTARIVGPDERLFMNVQVTTLNGSGGVDLTGIQLYWNLRFVASLKTNLGNRRNASR